MKSLASSEFVEIKRQCGPVIYRAEAPGAAFQVNGHICVNLIFLPHRSGHIHSPRSVAVPLPVVPSKHRHPCPRNLDMEFGQRCSGEEVLLAPERAEGRLR